MNGALFPPADSPATPPPLPGLKRAFGDRFGSVAAMRGFLQLIWFPRSRAWRYQLNGKSGTSFALNLLFELEFGHPFTTRVAASETGNQHPDFALFQQAEARLLSNPLRVKETWTAFRAFPGLTLATVRDPYARALSGFVYLCRSHAMGDRRFLSERLRLNALAGFDWDCHPDTAEGFERFLQYLRDQATAFGAETLDPHWRPQALHIRPEITRPDLIGRTEALDVFARAVAERLDRPLPAALRDQRLNVTGGGARAGDLYDAGRRRLVEEFYAEDFALFDYPRA